MYIVFDNTFAQTYDKISSRSIEYSKTEVCRAWLAANETTLLDTEVTTSENRMTLRTSTLTYSSGYPALLHRRKLSPPMPITTSQFRAEVYLWWTRGSSGNKKRHRSGQSERRTQMDIWRDLVVKNRGEMMHEKLIVQYPLDKPLAAAATVDSEAASATDIHHRRLPPHSSSPLLAPAAVVYDNES